MKKSLTILLLLTASIVFAKTSSTLMLTTGDDKEAGKALSSFLKAHGMKVQTPPDTLKQKGYILLEYNDHIYFLSPKVMKDPTRIDRILIYEMFQIKKDKVSTNEFKDWVLKLNNEFNIGSFSFAKDVFVVTSQLTFLNVLSIEEVKAFLKDFSMGVTNALIMSGGDKYLK